MAITLYDAVIPSNLQILGSVSGLIDKAEAHMAEHGVSEEELIAARLAPDMLPLSYQIKASAEHSKGAIEGVRAGVYSPDLTPPPTSFAALREKLDAAKAFLSALDPAEVNGFEGQDMRFEFGERKMPFTAENFLLSFALPNFFFHSTTAYDILRYKGVKIGKPDFLGAVRIKH
jgi:uncharacterized protein